METGKQETKSIVIDFLYHSQDNQLMIHLLKNIENKYNFYRIYVVGEKCILEELKQPFHNAFFSIIDRDTKEHKDILKQAEYIIRDSQFPKNFTPRKSQKIMYFCSRYSIDNNDIILEQKTLRRSNFNVFESSLFAKEYLLHFGCYSILDTNCIISNFCKESITILALLFEGEDKHIEYYKKNNQKDNIVIYVDRISNIHQETLIIHFLNQLDSKNNYFILSPKDISNFISNANLNKRIQYLHYSKSKYSSIERLMLKISSYSQWFECITWNVLKKSYCREVNKKLKGLHIDGLINFIDGTRYACKELSQVRCPLQYVSFNPYYLGVLTCKKWYKLNQVFKKKYYNQKICIEHILYSEEEMETFYNSSVEFTRCFSSVKKGINGVKYTLYFKTQLLIDIDNKNCQLLLNDRVVPAQINKGLLFNKLVFALKTEDIVELPAQNKLFISYIDSNGLGIKKDIKYKKDGLRKHQYMKSKILNIDGKTSCYLRQSQKNRVYLTVRPHNRTDNFIENLKINIAYYISFFFHKKIYILYEKDSSRYEESASVVFENLIDLGYNNAYFILDQNYQDIDKIQEKYKKNIIHKYSFKHYLYFFMSQTFLGSELLIHSMELRIMNKHVLKKINSKDINYVFLQHGVMYMISLDSDSRKYFTPRKDGKGKYRVVTSSKEEERHFVELGGYNPQQLIVCGLPKYDRNVLYSDAGQIVIMPTWRPWEYNKATTDFQTTRYYKMLERIVESIDEKYKNDIIILPHPLFYNAAKKNDFTLKKYMKFNVKYDEILRNTRVLITDYSSIAYDAFYRGSRVVFYWEELDESLDNYGAHTKLMLNKDNIFGDVCYNANELSKVIEDNYENNQKDIYINRYQKLVEFHDGQNTKRLIESLKKENIL